MFPQDPSMGGMPLDEATLDEMLGISTLPEEQKALERQMRMAELLGQGARQYNPNAGRGRGAKANIGGAANAIAQGMEGYMYNQRNTENKATEASLLGRARQGRGAWMRARYGAPQPGGGPAAATPSEYQDVGEPEVTELPPEEEFPQFPEEDY